MSAFIYIFRGIALLVAMCIPSKRKATLARWKQTRLSRLILEIGFGILGLVVLLALCLLILQQLSASN